MRAGWRVADAAVAPIEQRRLLGVFTVILGSWTVLTSAAALLLPGSPRDAWFVLVMVAPIVVLPALWALACLWSVRLRVTMRALDFSAITAVQGMRIAGIAMLALWAAGVMTPVFALWAGGLDVVVGLTAVPLAYLVAVRCPVPRRLLRAWHGLGLLDFVVAVPLGLAATPSTLGVLGATPSTAAMFSFPLSFIPMVGVPFTIIMHLTALSRLRLGAVPHAGPLVHHG